VNGDDPVLRDNPFSSRYTRPGALAFVYSAGDSADTVLSRWRAAGRRGAIEGPHGSGKSTLLTELASRLVDDAVKLRTFVLRDGERRLPKGAHGGLGPNDVMIVDGFEQLSWWSRRQLLRAVHRVGAGLLVTSHKAVRDVPTIYSATTSAATAQLLVDRLTSQAGATPIANSQLESLYAAHGGDIRELMFRLYDLYESQRS